MSKNRQLLIKMLRKLKSMDHIRPESIPNIPIYMDQLTTFMDDQLATAKRYPEDKILTKTMINNYTKNGLLPPPEKKKYSKKHILLLSYIYYFKNMLTFRDISVLFQAMSGEGSGAAGQLSMEEIYQQVFSMQAKQARKLTKDIIEKFYDSQKTFQDLDSVSYRDDLQLFSFICELGFDVYIKKTLMEYLIDELREQQLQQSIRRKKTEDASANTRKRTES